MADRVVKVELLAQVNGYVAGMEKASQKTRELGSAAEKLAAQKAGFEALGRPLLVFGALAAAAVGVAVAKFAEFDQAMSNVKAATQETASNMGLLREAALRAGAETVFSATEAANAIEELGKAGLTTTQILDGGLDGALALASAGQLGVAEAAGIAAIAVKQFNLAGSDVPHVADLLAAGAGKAVGDVTDLAAALNQVGLIANGAGQSIEDTTGVLAAFADAGLLGSDAGTSLKNAIIKLQAPTAEAKGLMEEYGLSFYDTNGQMLGFADIAGQLESGMGDLSDETRNAALAQIFGTDALRVANVLYEEGAVGIQKYIDQTNDSGYAAKVAADRLDNLKGDVEKLGGSFDTFLIKSGSGANDVLRGLTQSATFLVDGLGSLSEPALASGIAVASVAAAMALTAGAVLTGVPKIAALKAGLDALKVSAGAAAKGVGLVGGALAVATLVIGAFVAEQARSKASADSFAESLDQTTGALTDYTEELVAKRLEEQGAFEGAKKAGISEKELTKAVLEGGNALDKVKDKLEDFSNSNRVAGERAGFLGSEEGILAGKIEKTSSELDNGREALKRVKKATDENAGSTTGAAKAYETAADKAAELESNLSTLIDTVNKANGVGQDAVSTNAAYQGALQDVKDTLADLDPATGLARTGAEALARTIDESTEAGAANADMFADLAGKSQAAAEAQFKLDGNTETYRANLEAGRQTLYDQILALTGNSDAAQILTDKIYAMPSEKEIKILADTAQATWTVDDFIARMGQKVGVINFRANMPDLNGAASGNGQMGTFAEGGAIAGPGTGTSDSIPARLSNGEHVWTAAEVLAAGGQAAMYRMRAEVRRGFAAGGAVEPMRYMASPAYAGGMSGAGSSSAPIQRVSETIVVEVSGRALATASREYDRSLK